MKKNLCLLEKIQRAINRQIPFKFGACVFHWIIDRELEGGAALQFYIPYPDGKGPGWGLGSVIASWDIASNDPQKLLWVLWRRRRFFCDPFGYATSDTGNLPDWLQKIRRNNRTPFKR